MYGGPPQKLRTPEPVKMPDGPLDPTPVAVAYENDCAYFETKAPKAIVRKPTLAATHTVEGDKKSADYDVAPAADKEDLINESIREYQRALREDPYNAEATLRLALAYDKVRRKGCALALLERLEKLAQNPKFSAEANAAIDQIEQRGNRKWFGDYRRDAMRAVGRP
jgi:tetratricopeptide (TPR) repeat protein